MMTSPISKMETTTSTKPITVRGLHWLRRLVVLWSLTVRGCGDLPNCGPHPGTMWLVMFTAMGALAGLDGGIVKALCGSGLMLIVFGPMYLAGAYDRAKTDERIGEHNI